MNRASSSRPCRLRASFIVTIEGGVGGGKLRAQQDRLRAEIEAKAKGWAVADCPGGGEVL